MSFLQTAQTTPSARTDLAKYLTVLFEHVDFEDTHKGCLVLRGIGEKGTEKEGKFKEPAVVTPGAFTTDQIMGHVQRWGGHQIASFILPAVMDMKCVDDREATEDRVKFFTAIVVDIDKGDTSEKLNHAVTHLGPCAMIVRSGGTTETGHPKLHIYWRLTEPSDEIEKIAAARKVLALKLGGDPAFGRSTQVIRVPGSIYAKGGVSKLVEIESCLDDVDIELSDILERISDMPLAPGVTPLESAPLLARPSGFGTGNGLNFGEFVSSGGDRGDTSKAPVAFSMTHPVDEGGTEDRNRWSEFNRVAGHYIHTVRTGGATLDEAKELTLGWMNANMRPPWPIVRFESEWRALVNHDVKAKGALPTPTPPQNTGQTSLNQQWSPTPNRLIDWRVDQWTGGQRPLRKFLVRGLIMAGKQHLFAAEGGAGKTFMLLDLAMKIAAHEEGDGMEWCGLPLENDAGGTAVMFTTEDDKDELHIRLSDIDKDALRFRAGERLIVVPTINAGGSFPLVERDRATGRAVISQAWAAQLEQLRQIKDLRLVIIDTLNSTMHGEENSATIINEYIRAASVVCGEMGAALVITHHVRKPGQAQIYTAADMAAAVRGSSALGAAMRGVLGIWHAPDYDKRMARMGLTPEPNRLYNLAVLKANNPEVIRDMRTLLRQPSGMLVDCTRTEAQAAATKVSQEEAWLLKAIEEAAKAFHPFTRTGARGLFARRHELPAILRGSAKHALPDLAQRLLDKDLIGVCNPKGATSKNHLDVKFGPLASGIGDDGGPYQTEIGEWDRPSWEHEFEYDPTLERIVKKGQAGRLSVRPFPAATKATVHDIEAGFEGSPVSAPDAQDDDANTSKIGVPGNGLGTAGND